MTKIFPSKNRKNNPLHCSSLCYNLNQEQQGTMINIKAIRSEDVMVKYTARLTKGGSNSWAVEFRHPVLKNREGKQGRKIRRGLGNAPVEAQKVVDDINILLSDESFWSLTEQRRATQSVDSRAVNIFYDQIENEVVKDSWEQREEFIKIPDKAEGYSRVMLLGTTGAGKTTVVRQVIGTEPEEISFPAISASRTTICNTEFIFHDGEWRSIVTFITQSQVISLIEECIWEAFKRAVIGEDEKTIAKALLAHPEQRFRLSYFLGQYRSPKKIVYTNIISVDQIDEIPYPDQNVLQDELQYILKEIQLLATEAKEEFSPEDENIDEVIDLLFEVWIKEDTERFNELVEFILHLIKKRFEVIKIGNLRRDTRGWPVTWTHTSNDKSEVINMMGWFAGNEGRRFGQLLAPVVNGVRIQGPFKPRWWKHEELPRLVIIDGEGVGHDSNITTSLSMEVTNRFNEVDAIVLVDNATQPMLDIPKVILRDASSRGQQDKLIVAYTRFDQVEGSNMINDEERRDYVLGIQNGAVEAMQEAYNLNPKMIRLLRDHLKVNTFFFPNTNELRDPTIELQEEMIAFIESVVQKARPQSETGVFLVPRYDFGRLVLVITEAEELFMRKWLGLLGIKSSQFPKQHWARIKALSNRFATWSNVVSYKDLEPASDLAGYIIERLNEFLNAPKDWKGVGTEDEKQQVLRRLSSSLSFKLNGLVVTRLKIESHPQWIVALNYRGPGSTTTRAQEIRSIYEKALPLPKISYNPSSGDLFDKLTELIADSIKEIEDESKEK